MIANFESDLPARLGIADRHQNGEHRGGRLSSCQKKSLVLFTAVCFFVLPRASKNLASRQNKKTGGKLWAGPPNTGKDSVVLAHIEEFFDIDAVAPQ